MTTFHITTDTDPNESCYIRRRKRRSKRTLAGQRKPEADKCTEEVCETLFPSSPGSGDGTLALAPRAPTHSSHPTPFRRNNTLLRKHPPPSTATRHAPTEPPTYLTVSAVHTRAIHTRSNPQPDSGYITEFLEGTTHKHSQL